jgi:hypothetical protein
LLLLLLLLFIDVTVKRFDDAVVFASVDLGKTLK